MAPTAAKRERCYRQREVEKDSSSISSGSSSSSSETSSLELPSCSNSCRDINSTISAGDDHKKENNGLMTPKGKRFRIPEMLSCPPAPMKPRVGPKLLSRRSSAIKFFAPPDIELFFFLAFHDVSA